MDLSYMGIEFPPCLKLLVTTFANLGSVKQHMALEVVILNEALAAFITLIRLYAFVLYPHVITE